MKITFLGLSCFLIESKTGAKILLEPFDDSIEFGIGPTLPKNLEADFIYSSHLDPDHYNPRLRPTSKTNLFLKKTIPSHEFGGDDFNINLFEIDNLKICHLADQSTQLSDEQLSELGNIDIVFSPVPKVDKNTKKDLLEIVKQNLGKLNPKLIIWSHLVLPDGWQGKNESELRDLFQSYLTKHASSNKNYKNAESFIELSYVLENTIELTKTFDTLIVEGNSIEIDDLWSKKQSILFSKMN